MASPMPPLSSPPKCCSKPAHIFSFAVEHGEYTSRRAATETNAQRALAGEAPAPAQAFRKAAPKGASNKKSGGSGPRPVGPPDIEVLTRHSCYLEWRAQGLGYTAARHRAGQYYEYFVARTQEEVLARVLKDTRTGKEPFWFVRVEDTYPTDLYLDCEEEGVEALDSEADFFSRCQVGAAFVLASLEAAYGVCLSRGDAAVNVRWLTACLAAARKNSFHAHFLGLPFRDREALAEAMEKLVLRNLEALEAACPEHPIVLALRRRGYAGNDRRLRWIIDFTVYSKDRNFRMALQSKRPDAKAAKPEYDESSGRILPYKPTLRPLLPFDPATRAPLKDYSAEEWLHATAILRPGWTGPVLPSPAEVRRVAREEAVEMTRQRLAQMQAGSETWEKRLAACVSMYLRTLHSSAFVASSSPPPDFSLFRRKLIACLERMRQSHGDNPPEDDDDTLLARGVRGALAAWWASLTLARHKRQGRGDEEADAGDVVETADWLAWLRDAERVKKIVPRVARASLGENWRAEDLLGDGEAEIEQVSGGAASASLEWDALTRDALCRRFCFLASIDTWLPQKRVASGAHPPRTLEQLLYAWPEDWAPWYSRRLREDAAARGEHAYDSDNEEDEMEVDDDSRLGWICAKPCTKLTWAGLARESSRWEREASDWSRELSRASPLARQLVLATAPTSTEPGKKRPRPSAATVAPPPKKVAFKAPLSSPAPAAAPPPPSLPPQSDHRNRDDDDVVAAESMPPPQPIEQRSSSYLGKMDLTLKVDFSWRDPGCKRSDVANERPVKLEPAVPSPSSLLHLPASLEFLMRYAPFTLCLGGGSSSSSSVAPAPTANVQ